ncbi:hypothetical protein K2173_016078 [Erythroxylum novogranatense]|uniref:PDZ domain-containing protein n=1 Tax=Erythroxylum novogranatense TaxID=1862640 RepID=A0AAV8SF93_9ROSI|nr:hypothetical protein K2173_016078 [Erythroxylum novogranatense]
MEKKLFLFSSPLSLLLRQDPQLHSPPPRHSRGDCRHCLPHRVVHLSAWILWHRFVESFIARPSNDAWDLDDGTTTDPNYLLKEDHRLVTVPPPISTPPPLISSLTSQEDEEIIKSVVSGTIPSYSLESKLGDCKRAALIWREAIQRMTRRSLEGLPLEGFDYDSILEQCCERSVGCVQIPVGIAGPLLLDGDRQLGLTGKGEIHAEVQRELLLINHGLPPTKRDSFDRLILGDIITSVNGKKVTNGDLYRILDQFKVGEKVMVEVLRGDHKEKIPVVLEPKPDES